MLGFGFINNRFNSYVAYQGCAERVAPFQPPPGRMLFHRLPPRSSLCSMRCPPVKLCLSCPREPLGVHEGLEQQEDGEAGGEVWGWDVAFPHVSLVELCRANCLVPPSS